MSNAEAMLEKIEAELNAQLHEFEQTTYGGLTEVFEYQMGWTGREKKSRGKRIRPLLMILTADAYGVAWEKAIPSAAALELLHNYSLIHDDIEDSSRLRRGKDTVWVKYGRAQAINTGDAMINLALLASWKLEKDFPREITAEVVKILQKRSLELTQGQYLDIDFEAREKVTEDEYFSMVEGKTCSLFKAAFETGGILGMASVSERRLLEECGSAFGRAYQIQDDWLGIWGVESVTGKSNLSDLRERKKSYPVVLGLFTSKEFSTAWRNFTEDQLPDLARMLETVGIKKKCEKEFDDEFSKTISLLNQLDCDTKKIGVLSDLVRSLLQRQF